MVRTSVSLCFLTLAACWAASCAASHDWPEFRGPTGQGLCMLDNLPIQWNPTDNVAWKKTIPGKGWSSPVVVGDQIFLTTAIADRKDLKVQSLQARCLDAATGEDIWQREVVRAAVKPIHAKNSFASPTPVVEGGTLYVHFGPEGTAALDLAGNTIWTNTQIEYDARHGGGGSPIISGDLLIFNCDGAVDPFVIALDKKTGEERWRAYRQQIEFERFSFSTPLEIQVNGESQIVSVGSNYVYSYRPENGSEIWRVGFSRRWSIIPRPVYAHGLVYATTGYEGPCSLLAIRPDGSGDVTSTHLQWQLDKSAPHTPSPLVVDDLLFTVSDDGIASCLDPRTGRRHWRKRLGGNFSASPLYAGGNVYCQNEQGVCTVFQAADAYVAIARNDLEERCFASFAAADGALFIRTETQLYRIENKH